MIRPLGDGRLDGRSEVEQAQGIRDRRAGPPDARGDLLVREAELVDQLAEAMRSLDRVEVLTLQVLDEREFELRSLIELADDAPGCARGRPSGGANRRSPATSW